MIDVKELTRAELEQQVALMHEQLTAVAACRMMERFYAFDAIKDDACPACGGRVRVMRDHNSLMLEAA